MDVRTVKGRTVINGHLVEKRPSKVTHDIEGHPVINGVFRDVRIPMEAEIHRRTPKPTESKAMERRRKQMEKANAKKASVTTEGQEGSAGRGTSTQVGE